MHKVCIVPALYVYVDRYTLAETTQQMRVQVNLITVHLCHCVSLSLTWPDTAPSPMTVGPWYIINSILILNFSSILSLNWFNSESACNQDDSVMDRKSSTPVPSPSQGQGHRYNVCSFDVPTKCQHCTSLMVGLQRQGYHCAGM